MDIRRCLDRAVLRQFMASDRAETAYALGDLDAPHWELSQYWSGFDRENLTGFVLVYTGFSTPVLTMHGSEETIAAVLETISLPSDVFCMFPERLLPVFEDTYSVGHLIHLWRMYTTRDTFRPPAARLPMVRLLGKDAARLNTFYEQSLGTDEELLAFSPTQVEHGVFFAYEEDGNILAAAGTHVASSQERVAAVGNVFTTPGARGRGLGTQVTTAVVEQLLANGIETIVLNVKQTNHPAIHVYQKLGFQTHSPFVEGPAFIRP
ncbi:MAG: GNAT family N-acetyltransferase [Anaerolineae bacterium]|nr:GNAT family N-acetyltransferase [Anaerolineae bacterium]